MNVFDHTRGDHLGIINTEDAAKQEVFRKNNTIIIEIILSLIEEIVDCTTITCLNTQTVLLLELRNYNQGQCERFFNIFNVAFSWSFLIHSKTINIHLHFLLL